MHKDTVARHVKEVHRMSPLSENLKEVVYGGIDGIVTTFAVVAGFSGASFAGMGDMTLPIVVVVLFGFANLCADGFSMAVSDFLSSRAEKKLYEREYATELHEIRTNPQFEYDESLFLLQEKGFSQEDATQLVALYQKNPAFWAEFMMRYELDMPRPSATPWKGALFTFVSFLFFGALPLIPYVFQVHSVSPFLVSSLCGGAALALLGLVRAQFTQERVLVSVGEILGLGAVAGLIAYGVGRLIG